MNNQGMQVQLPARVTLNLSTQDAITTLGALQDAGPYKTVFPVIRAIETQLMAQQVQAKAPIVPPPVEPGIPPDAPADVPTEEIRHIPV